MGRFIGWIDLEVIPGDARDWLVKFPFEYTTNAGDIIWVCAGLKTDLASTPRIVWNIYPPFGLYTGAAVIHDQLYTEIGHISYLDSNNHIIAKILTKEECDDIFLEAMEAEGVSWISRHIIFWAVRAFGIFAWNEHVKAYSNRSLPS